VLLLLSVSVSASVIAAHGKQATLQLSIGLLRLVPAKMPSSLLNNLVQRRAMMSQTFQARVQAIDRTVLTPLVRQALGNPVAEVLDWEQRPLGGPVVQALEGVIGRVHFTGQARVQDQVVPWTLVLKAFAPPPGESNSDQTVFTYWKREVLTYQSGMLAALGGGLAAPRCFAVVEYSGEEYWVWIEYIVEETTQWSLAEFQLAARHLGQYNGVALRQGAVPALPWLTMGHLAARVQLWEVGLQRLPQLVQQPPVWLSAASLARTLHLYTEHPKLLAALRQLPHVLCHQDAHRRNLMLRRTPAGTVQLVAIDWSALGWATLGEEIGVMIGSGFYFLDAPTIEPRQLAEAVFAAYLTGLQEAGWRGEERAVRLSFTTTMATILVLSCFGHTLANIEDDEYWSFVETFFGLPHTTVQAYWREVYEVGLDLGDEALTLLDQMAR
jgi:hypothetical protein